MIFSNLSMVGVLWPNAGIVQGRKLGSALSQELARVDYL